MAGEVTIADEGIGVVAVAVSESVAEQPIGQGANHRVQKILDQNVGGVFTTNGTALQIREAGLTVREGKEGWAGKRKEGQLSNLSLQERQTRGRTDRHIDGQTDKQTKTK